MARTGALAQAPRPGGGTRRWNVSMEVVRDRSALGIIGVGAIAAASVEGVMRADPDAGIVLSPRGVAQAAVLADRFSAVAVAPDNQTVVDRCEVVLIWVRPDDAETVLPSLRFRAEQTPISVMAGVCLSVLRILVGPATACRAIPLPAVAQRRGSTPVFPSTEAARSLFDRPGGTVELADEP